MPEFKTTRPSIRVVAASVCALCMWSGTAHAGGFYLQEQSVKALGRAFSGEVADTGAESLWWNPAAIADGRGSAYAGATWIKPSATLRDTGTIIVRPAQAPAPVGGDPVAHNPISSGLLPAGGFAFSPAPWVSLGVAVTSPFSFTTDYRSDSWVRYTADKTSLRTIDIQPTLAFAPTRWLRIGGAVNFEHSKASLSNELPNLSPLLPDGFQRLKGSGWDTGWSAGVQVHQGGGTVAFSYKSSIRHTLDGSVETSGLLGLLAASNGSVNTKASFRTPWQAILGARYALTPQLTVNAQAARIGWRQFDAIHLGAPLNVSVPENYRNTWSLGAGLDFAVDPRWTIRGGVQHDQTPTRNGFRDARVPDSNRWNFALGTSFALTHGFNIDLGADYIAFRKAPIDRPTAAFAGTPVQTPILVSGTMTGAHAIVLGAGGRFSF